MSDKAAYRYYLSFAGFLGLILPFTVLYLAVSHG